MNGYVPYNESLYRVGFRPYNTNPRAAATLGGMDGPINRAWGSFGPWVLHGMGDIGQTIPFTARGGQALHGLGALGAMVPDGSIVIYQGKWAPTSTVGAQDVVAAVTAQLQADGALAVRNVAQDSSWAQNTPPFPLNVGTFNVTLTLQVKNGMGFGDPNDIISIVRHYVYQVTGQFPVADSIPSVQPPAAPDGTPSAPIATGQPGLPGAPSPTGSTDWATWFQNNLGLVAGLGFALLVVPPLIKRIL
jgi:hypothetical protein